MQGTDPVGSGGRQTQTWSTARPHRTQRCTWFVEMPELLTIFDRFGDVKPRGSAGADPLPHRPRRPGPTLLTVKPSEQPRNSLSELRERTERVSNRAQLVAPGGGLGWDTFGARMALRASQDVRPGTVCQSHNCTGG